MNKDVIYIDTEDDITAVIGKIKESKQKIIALVPPKRIGMLQSAVNLRLLARMAETSNKKLVIVTNNKALMSLSAITMIPVAKNLQSKPELMHIDDPKDDDEDDDVIEGSKIPIGELATTVDEVIKESVEDAVETIDIDELDPPTDEKNTSKLKPKGVKIPDFQSFRKKLLIGLTSIILLAGFLVWAIIYAPSAKIIVTTKTMSAPVSATVKLSGSEPTSVEKNIIRTISKQIKKDLSIEFTATGKKDNGTKATGAITLSYDDMPNKKLPVDAGEKIRLGNRIFIIQGDIFITTDTPGKTGWGSGTVVAEENGESYNVASGSCEVIGLPNISCSSNSNMAGGASSIVSIVTAADVQKAKQVIVDMPVESAKQQLIKQFINGEKVIKDSFTVDRAEAVSIPDVGGEIPEGSKPKLTSATTYNISAIAKSELDIFLRANVAKQISNIKTQRVFDHGYDNVSLSGFVKNDQVATVNISTTGKIGPSIDEDYVKTYSKGKEFGDIQATLESIEGVSDVEVQFSYFWVSKVPADNSKITVKFISEK